ncbi:MAG: hypothetical protein ACYC0V_14040 [Armatimonadota bacterium]
MGKYQDIQQQLDEYGSFADWMIVDILWRDYGTTLILSLENNGGEPSVPERSAINLRFRLVQEFHLSNGLNETQLQDMSVINWGLSVIEGIDVNSAISFTSRYILLPMKFYHADVLLGVERRIDIIFADMIIEPIEIIKQESK